MDHFINPIKNQYADFNGRARRKDYWMYYLFYIIFYIVFLFIDNLTGSGVLALVYQLALLVPTIGITARRLHDTGRSGWWQLIGLIPVIGWIILIYFLVQDSCEDNDWGPNPKADISA